MAKKTYVGKYCKKRPGGRVLCRMLYIINALLLVLAAVKISCSVEANREPGGMVLSVGATTVEAGSVQTQTEAPEDTRAPLIQGIREILAYEGDAVSYRQGIIVTDDCDPAPELSVDTSQVDLSRAGSYTVTYFARDAAGNTSTGTAPVTVLAREAGYADLETIYASADATLGVIITGDMDVREQVEAIYRWSWKSCRYSGHSDRGDWRQTAYTMLTTGTGDCYGFFAVTKLLFERLGIPNIDVVKVKNSENDSEHFWSLVSVDGGNSWYHFDATPRLGQTEDFCLVTDAQLDAYSRNNRGSHNRDTSLYPATPEE